MKIILKGLFEGGELKKTKQRQSLWRGCNFLSGLKVKKRRKIDDVTFMNIFSFSLSWAWISLFSIVSEYGLRLKKEILTLNSMPVAKKTKHMNNIKLTLVF